MTAVEAAAIVAMAAAGGIQDATATAMSAPMACQTMPDLPHRYALVYPVSGALADTGSTRTSADGLARLIGPNRARVLRLLDQPRSTTQLAALTGLPPGAVGNHLRVLLDTGAVLRPRAGRDVLYWRTFLGDALVFDCCAP